MFEILSKNGEVLLIDGSNLANIKMFMYSVYTLEYIVFDDQFF